MLFFGARFALHSRARARLLKHGNPGVRQLASIFLRKVVQRHWSKLGAKGQKE